VHLAVNGGAAATHREEDVAQLNAMYFQQPLEQLTVIQHALYQVIVDQDHQINPNSNSAAHKLTNQSFDQYQTDSKDSQPSVIIKPQKSKQIA
jgi:hypothetical protein